MEPLYPSPSLAGRAFFGQDPPAVEQ